VKVLCCAERKLHHAASNNKKENHEVEKLKYFCMYSMQLYKSMQKRYLTLTGFDFRLNLMRQTATETSSQFKNVAKDSKNSGGLPT